MSLELQNAAAGALIAAAALYIVWRLLRVLRGKSGPRCSSCGGCPSSPPEPLVSIESPQKPSHAETLGSDSAEHPGYGADTTA